MNKQTHNRNSNAVTYIAVASVVLLFVNYNIFSKIITSTVPEIDYSVYEQNGPSKQETEQEAKQAELENNYTDLEVTSNDTKVGFLVNINKANMFSFDATSAVVPIEYPESVFDSKSDKYYVKDRNVSLCKTAIEAFNELANDFAKETGHEDLLIVDAYRSKETQQRVFDAKIAQLGEEQGKLIAQTPGASEHHTGFALDLSLYINGKQAEYDGTGDYEWITQNCHKYGFIIRYPEDKTAITGIGYEPWHLRYVGKPHAYYIMQNGLCLEEYIQKLSMYPVTSDKLSVTLDDGSVYTVYSASVSGDVGKIKVPKNKPFTLSGTNQGHIVVTVQETVILPEQSTDS